MILKSSLQHDSPHVALGTLPKTVQWAFSSVNSHMLLQVVRKHKWLGTSFTKLYVFSTLGILIYRVLLQNPCSCKWFDILGTSIGFFTLWILRCLFKLIDCAYDLEHCKHLYGFSPVWTLICWFKWPECANDLVHFEQL